MSNLQWKQSYTAVVDGKPFRIFIAEQNGFHASCLWFEREGNNLTFALENHFGTSPEKALQSTIDWLNKKFGSTLTIADLTS